MLELETPAIVSAAVEGQSKWKWQLRVDELGLYRWYLDGTVETHIRGGTLAAAEQALRRFVAHSLHGRLTITGSTEDARQHAPLPLGKTN